MNHQVAAATIEDLDAISREIYGPVEGGTTLLSPDEWQALKHCITEVWSSVLFELMGPLIRAYPDLDPDKKSHVHTVELNRRVQTTRRGLAAEIIAAGNNAEKLLGIAIERIKASCHEDEAAQFEDRAFRVRASIAAVRQFGDRLAQDVS